MFYIKSKKIKDTQLSPLKKCESKSFYLKINLEEINFLVSNIFSRVVHSFQNKYYFNK